MNFCFWNVNKKDLTDYFQELLDDNGIDLFFLAECNLKPSYVLSKINKTGNKFFYCPSIVCDKILIFSKFRETLFPLLGETPRISARKLYSAILTDSINVIALHYQSKVNWNNEDQAAHILETKLFIDSIEAQVNHKKTILFGDFNMHPFDYGMIQSTGFNSTMDRTIAKRLIRIVDKKKYDFFYNPMWSFLGDQGKGQVSGTIYYSPSKPISYHWNLFDQVLVRPELIDFFDLNYLDIITSIGKCSLLSSAGIINSAKFSDHLPIKFSLNI